MKNTNVKELIEFLSQFDGECVVRANSNVSSNNNTREWISVSVYNDDGSCEEVEYKITEIGFCEDILDN